MPRLKYSKTKEGKLLDCSRVDPAPLHHLGIREPRCTAERRRLILTLREVQRLREAHRCGPGRPLIGLRLSRTLPFILRCLKRDGKYLPPYRVVMDLATMCQDMGWPDHYLALVMAADWIVSRRGGKPQPRVTKPLETSPHRFILDELDPLEEDALLTDPAQLQHDAMIAHIRLRRDPEEVALSVPGGLLDREELRETIRYLRGALDLSRPRMAEEHGLSINTWLRMETLERGGAYLPHASTLLKLAALCREREWDHHAEVLEKAAGWDRRHQYPERKVQWGG